MTNEKKASMLEKVRALLAKAERTTNPHEAKAFSAKAQELMARYGIDEAMLGPSERSAIGNHTIDLGTRYTRGTYELLKYVAVVNEVQMVIWGSSKRRVMLIGYTSDIEMVEMLFTSLRVQSTNEMLALTAPLGVSTATFRNSFLYGYAREIGVRLLRAREEARRAAEADYGSGNLLPVLASKAVAVKEAVDQIATGKAPTFNKPKLDAESYNEGRKAGARADLGGRKVSGTHNAGELVR